MCLQSLKSYLHVLNLAPEIVVINYYFPVSFQFLKLSVLGSQVTGVHERAGRLVSVRRVLGIELGVVSLAEIKP